MTSYEIAWVKGYNACRLELLEEIEAELHDIIFRYTVSKERHGGGTVEWSDYLLNAEEVFNIIDKHKSGKRVEECQ